MWGTLKEGWVSLADRPANQTCDPIAASNCDVLCSTIQYSTYMYLRDAKPTPALVPE